MRNESLYSKLLILLSILSFIIVFYSIGYPDVPKKINFQGYVTDSDGNPLDGIATMLFSIYDVDTGGAALWSETQNVAVNGGIFNVNLGEVNPIDLPFDKQYYLGVKVGTDPEMIPRKSLTSVPYAFNAGSAELPTMSVCEVGTSILCYNGPSNTLDIGECKVGRSFCNSNGTGFEACQGEVLPTTEICDGLDNDCNGLVDDGETIPPTPTNCGVGACFGNTGQMECQGGSLVNTCDPFAGAAPNDTTCDGIDDDCDGAVDEDNTVCSCVSIGPDNNCNGVDDDCDGINDDDYLIIPSECGAVSCASTGHNICQNGTLVNTCDSEYEGPLGNSSCNDGVDNDCDGATDAADSGCTTACVPSSINDNTCDGVDDDCDGSFDEDYIPTQTTCGVGVCISTGQNICPSGTIVDTCIPNVPSENAEVTCNDMIDNDCDGLADSRDSNCAANNYAIDYSRTASSSAIRITRDSLDSIINIDNKPFTIEAWVKKKITGSLNGNIFSLLGNGGLLLHVEDNVPQFKVAIPNTSHPTSTVSVSCEITTLTDLWTHIAGVLTNEDHSGGPNNCASVGAEQPHIACYMNGVLKNCGSSGFTSITEISPLRPIITIGDLSPDREIEGIDPSQKFYGAIDDVRLWNVARTQTQIQQCMTQTLYDGGICNIDSTLRGYWMLNDGSGSSVFDYSGNELSGRVINYFFNENPDDGFFSSPWSDGWIPGYPLVLP